MPLEMFPGMSKCEVCGLIGTCGMDCKALHDGECEDEEMLAVWDYPMKGEHFIGIANSGVVTGIETAMMTGTEKRIVFRNPPKEPAPETKESLPGYPVMCD